MQQGIATAVEAGRVDDLGLLVIVDREGGPPYSMRVAPALYHAGVISKPDAMANIMRMGVTEYTAEGLVEEWAESDAWLVAELDDDHPYAEEEAHPPPERDWRVECLDCERTYTPKGREEPEECHACGSGNIETEQIEPDGSGDSPQIRVHCPECEELDLVLGVKAVGLSADGVREITDEKLEEMDGDTMECRNCGGEAEIEAPVGGGDGGGQ